MKTKLPLILRMQVVKIMRHPQTEAPNGPCELPTISGEGAVELVSIFVCESKTEKEGRGRVFQNFVIDFLCTEQPRSITICAYSEITKSRWPSVRCICAS